MHRIHSSARLGLNLVLLNSCMHGIVRKKSAIQFLPLRFFELHCVIRVNLYLKNIIQTISNIHLPSNIDNILDKSDRNKGKNIKERITSLRWLVSINLTSRELNLTFCKIIYFTSHDGDSQHFGQKLTPTNKVPLRATNK